VTTTTTAASAVVCGRPLRDIDVVAAAARRHLPDGPETETVAASGSASTFFGLLTASGFGDDDDGGGGRFWTLQDDEISAEAVRCRLTDGPEMETPAASGSASTTSGSDEDENASNVVLFQCGPNDEADDDGVVESTSGFQEALITGVGDGTGRAAESDASGVHLLSDNLV